MPPNAGTQSNRITDWNGEQDNPRTTVQCSSPSRNPNQHIHVPRSLLFSPFILRPKIWHRGPHPKAHWYMCADYNHYNYSPRNSSDVPVTHNFCSTGLSYRMNWWSSSGLINCSGVIQVASSIGNPCHSTKNSLTILLFLLTFCHRNIFSISSMAPQLQVHLLEKLVDPHVRLQSSSPLTKRHGTQGVSSNPQVGITCMPALLWSPSPGKAPQTAFAVSWGTFES